MVCLGVEVDSASFTLSVPQTRLEELRVATELEDWSSCSSYTRKQFKSLLGKLSYATTCVKSSCIFMSQAPFIVYERVGGGGIWEEGGGGGTRKKFA